MNKKLWYYPELLGRRSGELALIMGVVGTAWFIIAMLVNGANMMKLVIDMFNTLMTFVENLGWELVTLAVGAVVGYTYYMHRSSHKVFKSVCFLIMITWLMLVGITWLGFAVGITMQATFVLLGTIWFGSKVMLLFLRLGHAE